MTSAVYYNEFDPVAAAWLRELIKQGLLPKGDVDERSIIDVQGRDLAGYAQCHFFAGIGGWPLALDLAGWPTDEPVWTGSCPCQPFSIAGKGLGIEDERHLWPEFARLIDERRPATVFGEQVASKAGREWLAGVFVDLETMAYAVAGADLCAAGVGAPHIRQRLWWVAQSRCEQARRGVHRSIEGATQDQGGTPDQSGRSGGACLGGLLDANGARSQSREQTAETARYGRSIESTSCTGGVCDAFDEGLEGYSGNGDGGREPRRLDTQSRGPVAVPVRSCGLQHAARDGREQRRAKSSRRGAGGGCGWSDFDILPFRDGKFRRVESGTFPLAHGIPARVGRLRGYGNAIVPELAAQFICAFRETVA